MRLNSENKIIDFKSVPKQLYHLVPQDIFFKFTDKKGSYDCRNKSEWGMNESFIHTSNTKKILKERVADGKWRGYPLDTNFVLLKINKIKIKNVKITYAEYNGIKYYHIWSALPKNSIMVSKVTRNKDGTFRL